jgi:hypothetical protein
MIDETLDRTCVLCGGCVNVHFDFLVLLLHVDDGGQHELGDVEVQVVERGPVVRRVGVVDELLVLELPQLVPLVGLGQLPLLVELLALLGEGLQHQRLAGPFVLEGLELLDAVPHLARHVEHGRVLLAAVEELGQLDHLVGILDAVGPEGPPHGLFDQLRITQHALPVLLLGRLPEPILQILAQLVASVKQRLHTQRKGNHEKISISLSPKRKGRQRKARRIDTWRMALMSL